MSLSKGWLSFWNFWEKGQRSDLSHKNGGVGKIGGVVLKKGGGGGAGFFYFHNS